MLLPDGYKGKFFQTKDLECQFREYSLVGGVLYGPEGSTNYTGSLKFYTRDGMQNWREYDSAFSNGKLLWIKSTNNED